MYTWKNCLNYGSKLWRLDWIFFSGCGRKQGCCHHPLINRVCVYGVRVFLSIYHRKNVLYNKDIYRTCFPEVVVSLWQLFSTRRERASGCGSLDSGPKVKVNEWMKDNEYQYDALCALQSLTRSFRSSRCFAFAWDTNNNNIYNELITMFKVLPSFQPTQSRGTIATSQSHHGRRYCCGILPTLASSPPPRSSPRQRDDDVVAVSPRQP